MSGFGNAMLAVRDLTTVLTLNAKDIMEAIQERLDGVIDQTNADVGKIKTFSKERAATKERPANIVDFPQSKTVH